MIKESEKWPIQNNESKHLKNNYNINNNNAPLINKKSNGYAFAVNKKKGRNIRRQYLTFVDRIYL